MSEPKALGAGEWDMQVQWVDPEDVLPNPDNPNEEDDATFNALVASIQTDGWTQPATVVWDEGVGKYQIVAGEHRWRAARVLNVKLPVLLLPEEEYHQDRRDWALVKDNLLRGRMNPERFSRLYSRMAARYDAETLQALMGFTSEDAFNRLYKDVARALPPGMADALAATKTEIRTIDDLSTVLNRLFAEYGDTLDANYMVFQWAGKEILWVRADRPLWDVVSALAAETSAAGGDLAAVLRERLDRVI